MSEQHEEMMQVHPGTRQLMSLHVPPSNIQQYLDRVDYLGSRGLSGLGALKKYIYRHKRRAAKAKDSTKEIEWFKLAPLHGACMNGHVSTTLPFIYETMNASLNTFNKEGNTPLHQSVIWGRNACVVWLLEKGCDYTLLNKAGDNALEMAIKRLDKLNDPALQSKRLSQLDRDKLIREATDLINILTGVSEAPNYKYWAKHNPRHELVIEYSPWSMCMDNRVQLTLLRHLVVSNRATQLTKDELLLKRNLEKQIIENKRLEQEKLKLANLPKTIIPNLEEQMTKDLGNLDLLIALKAMSVKTYVDLINIDRDMIGRCENLDARERRTLWLWVKEQKNGVLSTVIGGGSSSGSKVTDPFENMSKTQIKKFKAEQRRIELDEDERRIGLDISFKSNLPEDAFRFMMGFLY